MTRLSSIFSFETLRLPRRPPVAALVAFACVLVLEASTRALLASGALRQDPSLREHVTAQVAVLRAQRPSVWLIGNSTLASGVDDSTLARAAGAAVKLTHGSATLRGSAAMLDYYLQRTAAPGQVIAFATVDDFNPHGMRAEYSREYQRLDRTGQLPSTELLALRSARGALRGELLALALRLQARLTGEERKALDDSGEASSYRGEPIPLESGGFSALGRDYAFDTAAFTELAGVARRHGVERVRLVLLPITDRLAQYHDRIAPLFPYAEVRARVKGACEASGIGFIDLGAPSSTYALFKDPYHLNAAGRVWLTAQLQSRLLLE